MQIVDVFGWLENKLKIQIVAAQLTFPVFKKLMSSRISPASN